MSKRFNLFPTQPQKSYYPEGKKDSAANSLFQLRETNRQTANQYQLIKDSGKTYWSEHVPGVPGTPTELLSTKKKTSNPQLYKRIGSSKTYNNGTGDRLQRLKTRAIAKASHTTQTYKIVPPPAPELFIVQQITSPTVNPAVFTIFTNIIGADMSLTDNTSAGATLSITSPSSKKSVSGQSTITLTQTSGGAIDGVYPNVKFTLTGGSSTSPPNNVRSVVLDPFDIDDIGPGADGAAMSFTPTGGLYRSETIQIKATFNKELQGPPEITLTGAGECCCY